MFSDTNHIKKYTIIHLPADADVTANTEKHNYLLVVLVLAEQTQKKKQNITSTKPKKKNQSGVLPIFIHI